MKSPQRWFVPASVVTFLIVTTYAGFVWLRGEGCNLFSADKPAAANDTSNARSDSTDFVIGVRAVNRSAVQVESEVVEPIERQLKSLSSVRRIRSASRDGFGSVCLDLAPNVDFSKAKAEIVERLRQIKLPADVKPTITRANWDKREVFLAGLRAPGRDALYVRAIAEKLVVPRLQALPGIEQVLVSGGMRKEYRIWLDPARVRQFNVSYSQISETLKKVADARAAAAHAPGTTGGVDSFPADMESAVVSIKKSIPVRIQDVAKVEVGGANNSGQTAISIKQGATTDSAPAVILTVLKSSDTDSATIRRLLEKVSQELPNDVKLDQQVFGEQDLCVQLEVPAGTSNDATSRLMRQAEAAVAEVTEVREIWHRGGINETLVRNEAPLLFVLLQADANRKLAAVREDLRAKLQRIPGIKIRFGEPRAVDLDCDGVAAQVALKVFGPDLQILQKIGRDFELELNSVAGVTDLRIEPTFDKPRLQFRPDMDRLKIFGISEAELNAAWEIATSGNVVAQVADGNTQVDVTLAMIESQPRHVSQLGRIPFVTSNGEVVFLEQLAKLVSTHGPSAIFREDSQRRLVVSCNIQERDRKSTIMAIRQSVTTLNGKLPKGYRAELAGSEFVTAP